MVVRHALEPVFRQGGAEQVQRQCGIPGGRGDGAAGKVKPGFVQTRHLVRKVDGAAGAERDGEEDFRLLTVHVDQCPVAGGEVGIGLIRRHENETAAHLGELGVVGCIEAAAEGEVRIVDPEFLVCPEPERHGRRIFHNAAPACVNVAADPCHIHIVLSAVEGVVAAEDVRSAESGFAGDADGQIHQMSAPDLFIGELSGRPGGAEEVQLEIFVAVTGIAVKKIVNELLGFFHGGVQNKGVSAHDPHAERALTVLRLTEHIRFHLCDPGVGIQHGGRDPETGLELQFFELFCHPGHAVGEEAVGIPFAVSILPAVVDNDLLNVLGKDRIFCNELGVFQHFIFRDGPAVVVPGVPAGIDVRGEIPVGFLVFFAVRVETLKAIAHPEGEGLELEIFCRDVLDAEPGFQVAHFPFFAGAAHDFLMIAHQREGEGKLGVFLRDEHHRISVKGGFFHALSIQRDQGAAAHSGALYGKVIGGDRCLIKVPDRQIFADLFQFSVQGQSQFPGGIHGGFQFPAAAFAVCRGGHAGGGGFCDLPGAERNIFSVHHQDGGKVFQFEIAIDERVFSGIKTEGCAAAYDLMLFRHFSVLLNFFLFFCCNIHRERVFLY